MRKLLYTVMLLGLVACGESKTEIPANMLVHNDYESVDGWLLDAGKPIPSLTKDRAHSGRFSIRVDQANEYSLGYTNQLGRISTSKLKKIKVHAWINVPNNRAGAALVVQVEGDGGKSLFWEGISLTDATKDYNKWTEMTKVLTLPDNLAYNNLLKVYLWRSGSNQPVYLDDLEITSVD
jgi:hypothetical protein